ncbi:MAG: hypothetical protein B7X83_03810 [Polynucleobacter sp. 17-46-58]|nr:MAG: hypothetical protein B7Y55_02075 [Polynucleobacter sp. 35-46-207]OYZ37220.1 MAG: hypothetical protein B7Y22_03805 [Polynucleobacter sp. 16-46-70]OZA40873.1 MAG: hypothetical protein B7X83_03810 [Polynucleobacter sp. 17-46-58]OZB48661.1 MAG: hypothetical protein B7X60_03435 [Polynucleobacter sp. 39-45-136]
MNLQEIQKTLCSSMCAEVTIEKLQGDLLAIKTPFQFADGDSYSIHLKRLPAGGFRISDSGLTLMHLSYEFDLDKLKDGARARRFEKTLNEVGIQAQDGELYLDVRGDALGEGVFRFGQAITQVHDISFLNRVQVENTFYDDLYENLKSIVGEDHIEKNYIIKNLPQSENYPIDFYIHTKNSLPLYLFGVPGRDKARLATIILQHLIAENLEFNSMIVFQNMSEIGSKDIGRLMNAANDMVASVDSEQDLSRKILQRVGSL